jgi:3-oxoadipate enol-lactonase
MPTAAINGIELYYESYGEGPAIVFAHGRGGNHFSWFQQLAAFQREYRCIVFDHRGWGLTSDVPGGPGTAAFVDDLAALLDHLEIDRAFLVSQSMGGITNLGFALRHPERVAGLVLGDTTGGIGDPSVVDLLKDVHPPEDSLRRALSAGFIREHSNRVVLFRQIGALNPAMPISVVSGLFRNPTGPQAANLAAFDVPTLLVVGEEDLIFPVHVMQAAQQLIPNSRLEIVPGAAHSTHFEQPAAFNGLVREFFAGIRVGEAAATTGD